MRGLLAGVSKAIKCHMGASRLPCGRTAAPWGRMATTVDYGNVEPGFYPTVPSSCGALKSHGGWCWE